MFNCISIPSLLILLPDYIKQQLTIKLVFQPRPKNIMISLNNSGIARKSPIL